MTAFSKVCSEISYFALDLCLWAMGSGNGNGNVKKRLQKHTQIFTANAGQSRWSRNEPLSSAEALVGYDYDYY